MSLCFIHAADLHLDSPFTCLSPTLPEELKEALLNAPYVALEEMCRLAVEKDASFCVLAGDIFDSGDHSLLSQTRFLRWVEFLSKNGIRTFIALGNHDPLNTTRLGDIDSKDITIFASEPQCFTIRAKDGTECAISGVSYRERRERRRLVRLFNQLDIPSRCFSIGVLHTNCGAVGGHGNYAPSTLEELSSAPVDYWALGHIHRRVILRDQDPAIAYSGVIQGRNFRETGPKGSNLVEVDGNSITIRPIDLSRITWLDMKIEAGDEARLDDLKRRIEEEVVKGVKPFGQSRFLSDRKGYFIVRLHIFGATSLKRELIKEEVISDLKDSVNETLFEDHSIWIDEIVDETKKSVNIHELPPEGLFAEIIGASNQILSSQKARERLMKELSPLLKKREITKNAGDVLTEIGLDELVMESRGLLLDLLEDDE